MANKNKLYATGLAIALAFSYGCASTQKKNSNKAEFYRLMEQAEKENKHMEEIYRKSQNLEKELDKLEDIINSF